MKIKGKVQFQNLEGGFWSIIDKNGINYRPVNMPEQLKLEGVEVELNAIAHNEMSFIMWGDPIKIISFSTLNP